MTLFSTSPADSNTVSVKFPNVFVKGGANMQFTKFLHFDYRQDFLTPSDQWSFSLDIDELTDVDLTAIVPRTRIEIYVDAQRQTVGFIDDIKIKCTPSGGAIMSIDGRDWLSPAVDCHIDPKTRFQPTMTFLDVVQAALGPFGVTAFAEDNDANRNAITGGKFGVRTKKNGKALKSAINHQLKPYPNEGAFAFASRVTQRAGLWIWPAADGETVIVGLPQFDQDPRYQLRHRLDDRGQLDNVLESDVTQSSKDQPTAIVATGWGGGGVYAKSPLKSGIINPVIESADVSNILDAYPEITFLPLPDGTVSFVNPIAEPGARPLFLYDPESHTQEQLDAFVYRELSLCMRKSLQAKYTIEGCKINGQAIAIDTVMDVDDDRSNLHQPMWVLGRTLTKDTSSGTRTTLDLIRPGSLLFGPKG
jgi:prophage tail gpP-like protein